MTNPIGHLYSGKLPDPPERFLGEPEAEPTGKKRRRSRRGTGPSFGDAAVNALLIDHPAVAGVAVGVIGLVGAVWALVKRRRRSR